MPSARPGREGRSLRRLDKGARPPASIDKKAPRVTPRKRKVLKIVGVVALLAIAALVGGGIYVYRGVHSIPLFYQRPALSGEERLAAIANVERKVLTFQSDLDAAYALAQVDAQADATAPATGPANGPATGPAAARAQAVEISFSGPELDTYFRKWMDDAGYTQRVGKYMTDPRIALHEGHVVLAGRMPDFGSVVSLHFLPSVDGSGVATLKLAGVYAGSIPLPEATFGEFKQRMAGALTEDGTALSREADISTAGIANAAAIRLGTQVQLLKMLRGQDLPGLVIFPGLAGRGNVPARVVEMSVEPEGLHLGVRLLTARQRAELLESLKQPQDDDERAETAGATVSGNRVTTRGA